METENIAGDINFGMNIVLLTDFYHYTTLATIMRWSCQKLEWWFLFAETLYGTIQLQLHTRVWFFTWYHAYLQLWSVHAKLKPWSTTTSGLNPRVV